MRLLRHTGLVACLFGSQFLYVPKSLAAGVTVSGKVFSDTNSDGLNAGDSGIQNVTVVLRNKTSNTCQSVKTDSSGNYSFTSVLAGNYEIIEAANETTPTPSTCTPAPGKTLAQTIGKDPTDYASTTPNVIPITVISSNITGNFGDHSARSLGSCPNPAYITLGGTTSTIKLNSVDLTSGALTTISASNFSSSINGIGFNLVDGYIYGAPSSGTFGLLRTNLDGTEENLGTVTDVNGSNPITGTSFVGDVDKDGIFYSVQGTTVYAIDVNPNSPTFKRYLKKFTITFPSPGGSSTSDINDLAISPIDGKAYTINNVGSYLLQFPDFSTVSNSGTATGISLGAVKKSSDNTPMPNGAKGAIYFAADGTLYAYRNTGSIYAVSTTFISVSPKFVTITDSAANVGLNDGARCMFAPAVTLPNTYTASGTLYKDNNNNGVNNSEPSLSANVTVTAYNDTNSNNIIDTNEQITTTTTDANGQYTLSNLFAGTYKIKVDTNDVDIPVGYTLNTPNDLSITISNASVSGKDFGFVSTDYGDAPSSYGTLLANDGARHTISGLYLGAGVTNETDGQPNATASADANDDGVTFSPTLGANYSTLIQAGVSNQATVVSSGSGFVNAWVDYNNNGVFDAGEKVLTNQPVVAGSNTVNFTIPNTALHGSTFARFRLSPTSVASSSPTGLITGGEVEDYQVNISAPVPDGAACTTTGLLNGGFELPVQAATTFIIQSEDNVPGWNTTATDKQIEIWSTNFLGVPSYEGNQFAEMNANQVAALYQDIATVPGSTITYQFAHRARTQNSAVVVDTAGVKAGSPGALVNLKTFSTDSTDWVVYQGTYVVPIGQYITRFQFDSISAGSGSVSVGNFLDAVQFSTNVCVTPISPPTIDLNGTATGTDYQNTFRIGGSAVAVASANTTISDDKTNITRAIFTLTTTPDGANESLTIDPTAGGTVTGVSVDVAYDSTAGTSTTGRLTIKGSATLADYQKVIATLKYSNTKASPTLTDRIINVQVIDSDKATSNTAVSTIKVSLPPANVLLVKRITAINGNRTKNPNDNTALNTFVDDTTSIYQTEDNNAGWPSGYLLGAIDAGKVKPGDDVEYTVYFLNSGGVKADSVKICDLIAGQQDFKPNAYGTSQDIELKIGKITNASTFLTQANDVGDRAQVIDPNGTVPASCNLKAANTISKTIVLDVTGTTGVPTLTTLKNTIGTGDPDDSFGFFRFTTTVKP